MATLTVRNCCLAVGGLIVVATLASPGRAFAQGFGYPSQPITIDFGGGPGGRNITNATCEPGSVAVGFRARIGEFFNEVWLECAPLRFDGSLAGGFRETAAAGQAGGKAEKSARCPNGQVLRGLKGRTGASIDQIAGVCSNPQEIRDNPEPRTAKTSTVSRPNSGGQPAEASCPVGSALVGFQTKSGEYIDHLWIQCTDLREASN